MGLKADETISLSFEELLGYLRSKTRVFMDVDDGQYYITHTDGYWRVQDCSQLNDKGRFTDCSELVTTAPNNVTAPNGDFQGQVFFSNDGDLDGLEENIEDVVVLAIDLSAAGHELSLDKRTLWIDNNRTNGFVFASDAKAVLIENFDGDLFDTVARSLREFDTGFGRIIDTATSGGRDAE